VRSDWKSDIDYLVNKFRVGKIFRQSKTNTLLCDRFGLDGMTNKLNRKLEVRFKRSRQKHEASKNMRKGATGLVNVDTLDFRDVNGNFFYEPTTELCLINNLQSGWFSVVLVPTIENDVYRWHIFAYNNVTKKVELTTLLMSEEGLFDVQDYTAFEESNDNLISRSLPGIIKRTLLNTLNTNFINGVKSTQLPPQAMPQIAKDDKGLITQGAWLGFVNPPSRLNAIETCEGNVQLSYFDSQGRMRLTNYDATSDSSNTAFEQWIPDAQRACLNFSNANSVVKLSQQVYLSTDWSIEAWFCYPLPETAQWNTLIRGQNADHNIIVSRDQKLGIYLTNDPLKQFFYDCG
jgi:hypothetical protein